jgi:hypothetical protein
MQELDAAGVNGFPYVKIDGEVIVGYQPDLYSKALSL